MRSDATAVRRLTLLVQRLHDADLLFDSEAEALLSEIETARRSLENGDMEACRRHVGQVVRATEALVRSDSLAAADGRSFLEAARRILPPDA